MCTDNFFFSGMYCLVKDQNYNCLNIIYKQPGIFELFCIVFQMFSLISNETAKLEINLLKLQIINFLAFI